VPGYLLTETGPLAELLAIGNLDEGDLVLGAEGDDELLVSLLLAGLVQDAHVRLSPVEGLGSLTETAGKTVVHERELENSLQGVQDGHLTLGGGIGGNLDLLGDLNGGVLFYVRLFVVKLLVHRLHQSKLGGGGEVSIVGAVVIARQHGAGWL